MPPRKAPRREKKPFVKAPPRPGSQPLPKGGAIPFPPSVPPTPSPKTSSSLPEIDEGDISIPAPRPRKDKNPSFEGYRDAEAKLKADIDNRNLTNLKHTLEAANVRDISVVPPNTHYKPINFNGINWERRLACKADPVLDLKTYMPSVFYLPFGDFHLNLIHEIDRAMQVGGKKAMALPRGSGKTAICRGSILRATKYGWKKFAFFIGSKEDKALQTLNFVRTMWHRSPELQQDFPEIAYPVYRIEGRGSAGAVGQTYRNERTYIQWGTSELTYAALLMTEEDVQSYLRNDPSSVIYLKAYDRWIAASAGTMVRVAGIDGSIRGEAEIHPVLLTQPRPDLVLIDDVQKDQTANSPTACEQIERLIEGAVDNLAAPDVNQACLMPCTVIREGDVSDTFLTPEKKPDWQGSRFGLVKSFPPCMDYEHIWDEIPNPKGGPPIPNPQGRAWLDYKELRDKSLRLHGNLKLANEFYREHQALLEAEFIPSWPERYKRNLKKPNPDVDEISPIQSLMNLRFKDHQSYLAEHENRPKTTISSDQIVLSAEEVQERQTNIPRYEVSTAWTQLVAFVDVQNEILFYTVFAFDLDYNGQFIDYGTYPDLKTPYFRKTQLGAWSALTRDYYRKHPEDPTRPANVFRDRGTHHRAPFDAKIYSALQSVTDYLLTKDYPRHDGNTTRIRALAIDTKWGQASDVIKRFVEETKNERIMCYEGHPFLPSFRQLEEYDAQPGSMFEHQMHPNCQESRWVVKPYSKGQWSRRFILADVSRWKTFLMKRLATPPGSTGAITLFQQDPVYHRMFAEHLTSENPEEIVARGMKKAIWKPKPGFINDNDYLDCSVGCMCLASICGASLKIGQKGEVMRTTKRSIRDIYNQKKGKSK